MADRTTYGDVSHQTAGKYWRQLLERAIPSLVTEKFAQTKPLDKNSGNLVTFTRYNSLPVATTPLAEGITPKSSKPTKTEVRAILQQYGDWIEITDRVTDFAEDPVLQEYKGILSEQMAETREVLNLALLKSGSSVYYANNVAGRANVVTFTTAGQLQKVSRFLLGQKAKYFTEILSGTPKYGTSPVNAAYVALIHTDLKADVRNLTGFIPVAEYADPTDRLDKMELGAVDDIRFVMTPLLTPWLGAGAATATMINTAGNADVYPIIVMGKDAWATVPLRGASSGRPTVVSANTPSKSDPLGQRGSIGWKYYHAGVILQDAFMVRVEVAATLNPA